MTEGADFSWTRLVVAFTTVLALMAGLGFVLKYFSVRGFTLPNRPLRTRRIQIVESVAIDTRRRFVIVRCDAREHFLLLGPERDIVVDTNLPPVAPLPPPSVNAS